MWKELVFLLLFCDSYRAHPQCLDFGPPFKPSAGLTFCSTFSSYSCCTKEKDIDLKQDYDYTIHTIQNSIAECEIFLKDLLCLECHPYASHIYDAEIPPANLTYFDKRRVNFPGLCKKYCVEKFDKCRLYILRIARHDDFHRFVQNSTKEEFCSWAELSDSNYCYPNIKNINKKSPVISNKNETITLCVEAVPEVFANPLVGVHANDGTYRMFIGEQRGLIHIVDHTGKKLSKPFLDIRKKILNSGSAWDERGLLGLVFHPQYKQNGHFYVYYSAPLQGQNYSTGQWWTKKHKSRLSEFTVDPKNPNKADNESEFVIIEIKQPEANHNGGMLLFGRDGYLYLFPGDGGGAGDQHGKYGNALNMSSLLGKALRIDVDDYNKEYSIPKDNPFISMKNVKPEIYAFGLRNAWRCSIDGGLMKQRGTGRLFCGDVGQNKYEEINIIEKGENYGWRAFEGFSCYDSKLCQKYRKAKQPILTYNHSIGQSIVGGYVYRGCDNPKLFGKYIYADTMNGRLFAAEESGESWNTKEIIMGDYSMCNNGLVGFYVKNILSFAESESSEIYLLSSYSPSPNQLNGRMYRLVDPTLRGDPQNCQIKPKLAKELKTIKRRGIYHELKHLRKKTIPLKTVCKDVRPYICNRYFKPYKGKKAALTCNAAKSYTKKYCKKSCSFC